MSTSQGRPSRWSRDQHRQWSWGEWQWWQSDQEAGHPNERLWTEGVDSLPTVTQSENQGKWREDNQGGAGYGGDGAGSAWGGAGSAGVPAAGLRTEGVDSGLTVEQSENRKSGPQDNQGGAGSGGDSAGAGSAGGGVGSAGVPTADSDMMEIEDVMMEIEEARRKNFNAMMEIEDLRTKQEWADFVGTVRHAINGGPRAALAQHTRTTQTATGLENNLVLQEASGADDSHPIGGMHECRIALRNLLEPGDGLTLHYVSERKQSKKQAQTDAFVEILSYILFRGPKHLRTCASQWHAEELSEVKNDAGGLRGRLGPRPRGQWSPLSEPSDGVAQEPRQPLERSRARSCYAAPEGGENPADRDYRILNALIRVPRNRQNRGELPSCVWQILARELPPGGLLPFLQRFPEIFIIENRKPLVWRRL
jgi:hypothetical protein